MQEPILIRTRTRHNRRQGWHIGSRLRQARLLSGLILFAYVTTHLINHALCNASVAVADTFLLAQKFVWQGVVGTVLFYGALLVHALLGLQALYVRRRFHNRGAEALQLALGLAIPAMLANHLAVTRTALTLYGLNKGYIAELDSLWVAHPLLGLLQVAVLLVAWVHACLGLYFLLRLRRWFPAWRPVLLATAVLLPALALLGYVHGGREVARALAQPGFHITYLGTGVTGTPAQAANLTRLRNGFLVLYGAALIVVLLARLVRRLREWRRGLVTISYQGGARVRIAPGISVLDASAAGGIPHASVCGGKGRCSTCRVRVLASAETLPEPSRHERALLTSIGADANRVRLACQLRPRADLHVVPMIPPAFARQFVAGQALRVPEEERFVAAMFVDLRGSTEMAEQRAPFDSVFLLGRFIGSVSSAILQSGGRPVQFLGDGVLALFGLEAPPQTACRNALDAIDAIRKALVDVAALFEQETGQALRFGIGVHCGRAIVGEISLCDQIGFTALGGTVNIAHRLQEMARDLGAEAVVSDDVFATAEMESPCYEPRDAALRGRLDKLRIRTLNAATAGRDLATA
jgi:adenylate cyclase